MEKAWAFFSDPRNLAFITPPEMDFVVKTPLTAGEFYSGMLIEYIVRPFAGIPVRWISEIQHVENHRQFVDVQVSGPYASWVHRHEFVQVAGGVEVRDIVTYQLAFGRLGRLLHRLIVRRKLEYIFDYRSRKIQFLFQT
jgi:ligand-binding SRPBCC domain-containing protein